MHPSEPRGEMPGLVLRAIVGGLLGKLACVSKEFRKACKEEAFLRARAAGAEVPPENPLPPVSIRLFTTAAEVDWALGFGCLTCSELSEVLAAGGCVAALARAVERGAPMTFVCDVAAKEGRMEVLQWARKNGCPWN
jgi:hypothetical protein